MARRKSKSKREENTPAGGTPSDSEWLTMQPCDKIAVCTEDSVEYPFCVGDTVSLLSPDGKRDEWYAKIEDIRQREGEDNDVWVKVRWYYSPEEVDNAINGVEGKSNRKSLGEETDMVFDPEFCSPTERILSDHCDIIHSLSLEDVVKITFFDESNLLEQKDITHGELFCRYTLSIHPFDNPPKLSAPVSPCLCSRGYNLSQSDPAQAMRVCAECKRPWHHTCLVSGGFSEDVGLEKILHGILGQQDAEQESRVDRSPQKKRRLDAASRQSPYSSRRFLTLLERTPPSLLLLAAQPLIRGSCRSIPLPIPLPAPSFADSSHLPSSPSKRSAKHAKKTSTNNNIDLPITSKYTTPKSLPITGNVRAVTRARRKLRSLALVLGREVTDYETDEEDEEDEEDAQTQTPARLGKRKLSRIEVSKPSAKSTSTSKSKGKNKNNAPKDRGRTQTKGKGKGRGRSSRTSLSKARSISDVDTDDTGAGDLSREEEYQVLQALEPSDESSPGSPSGSLAPLPPPYTPPPSSPELGPVSLPSPATRSKRTAASSSLPKKSKAAGLQGRAQTESDANWLGEWEPEPGWEGFIVTPIRLPASFSLDGVSGSAQPKEEEPEKTEEGSPTRRVTRRSRMKHVDSTVDVSESKDGGTTITVPLIPSPTRLTRSAAASEAKVLRSKSISRSHFENHVALPIIDGKGKRGKNAAVTKDGDKVVPARMDSETDLATDGDDKANSPEKRGRGRLRNSSKKQTKVEVNGIASGEESGILGNGKVQSQYLIYPPAAPSSIFSPGLKTLSSRSKKAGEEDSEADLQERKVLEMFRCPGCGTLI